VRRVESHSVRDADADYYYGIALAQIGRLDDARKSLLLGHRREPGEKRFLIELAGVAFKQKNHSEAARWLQAALRIDPRDAYANEFLATIYFVQGNLEAALKYWNRIEKPQIANISTPQDLKIRPALLDRAFLFSPASMLQLQDLLTSEKRVSGLGIFPQYNFELLARDDGKFDVNVRGRESDGFGTNRWLALHSTFRGVFYQTISPEYFNAAGKAINVTSLLRWDAKKRRLAVSYSAPLNSNPKFRYQLGLDLRNENWAIVPSFKGPAPLLGGLNLRTEAFAAGISSFNSGRWDWSVGGEISDRQYRNLFTGTALEPSVLLTGLELKQSGRLNYEILRVPEKRLVITSSASEQIAGV